MAVSIFHIENGNGHGNGKEALDDGDSDDEVHYFIPKVDEAVDVETVCRAPTTTSAKKLVCQTNQTIPGRFQKQTHHQVRTIEEQRRTYDAYGNASFKHTLLTTNGKGTGVGSSPPLHGTDSDGEEFHSANPGQARKAANGVAVTKESELVNCSNGAPANGKMQPLIRKRWTRKTISPDDPAESLTEMSVRGLNLFRYATVNEGLYQCMECSKDGNAKTFKNKYSFQRHAFLYHEGKQRKVFPCLVCNKEFSRPDKMKNHWRTAHVAFEAKCDPASPNSSLLPNQSVDLVQLHLHLQHHQLQQQQQLEQEQNNLQQNGARAEQQLDAELDKRRQQQQDVLKIRHAVNAITLRQLQQIQYQQQEKEPEQQVQGPVAAPQPAEQNQRMISQSNLESSVPSQLIVLNGMGSH